MNKYLATCIDAVNRASKIANENFRTGIRKKRKSDSSFVTKIDILAEQSMRQIITTRFPHHKIIGEELGGAIDNNHYTWILDPIDGTRNYAYGIPIFACGGALLKDNQIICSAIGLPAQGEIYYSELNRGSFNSQSQISIKDKVQFSSCLIATSRSKKFQSEFSQLINGLTNKIGELRILGSGLTSIAFVASGQLDGVVGYIPKAWDVLPAIQIATQAGAIALDYKGNPWQIGNPQLVIAHPIIAKKIIEHLNVAGFN